MFIFKRGEKYHLQYFSEAENRTKRISTGATKKQDALKFLNEFSSELSNQQKTKFISFRDFISQYQTFVDSTLSKKHSQSVKNTFAVIEKVIPGEKPLKKITGNELEKFFIESYRRSKNTASLYFRIIRAALNKAIQWNYISDNPTSKIKLPKIPTKINQYLSEVQFQTILQYEETELIKDVFTFAYNTGARLSEITNLKWSSINLTDRLIKISNTESFTTKGKEERVIPINETLLSVLQKRTPKIFEIGKDYFVFAINGFQINNDFISKRFKKALRKANKFGASINPLIHFHHLRASFISNLAKRNVPLHIVQKLVGHRLLSVTSKYYLSVQTESMFDAMRTLDIKPEGLINANN